jgi:acetyl/propionyl-CoA carboxylase alpha subunit
VFTGQELTLHYDNLLLKVIAHANSRDAAIARLRRALHELRLPGVTTNRPLLLRVLDHPDFVSGTYDTSILDNMPAPVPAADDFLPAVAAALAAHRRVRKTAVPAPSAHGGPSPWVRAGRMRAMRRSR